MLEFRRQLYTHITHNWLFWLYAIAIILVLFFHFWQLGSIPRGLYVDESGIGYNGLLIGRTGVDEHGKKWPIYFESFGDYKSPLVVYATALTTTILGPSDFSVRLTGFIFHILLLIGMYLLATELFPRQKSIGLYALIATGFLPWIFTISRLGFEVVTQPALVVLALWLLLKTERTDRQTKGILYAAFAGAIVGLSLYTYSTARLLTPLMAISWFTLYFFKLPKERIISFSSSLIFVCLPHFYYYLTQPDHLTARFKLLTYIYNPALSLTEKVATFLTKYFSYFGPEFLIFNAIEPRLHMTNFGGELLIAVFFLACLGIIVLVSGKKIASRRFTIFLAINFLLSPIAASLTGPIGEHPHGFRSILLGIYFIIFSLFGFSFLLDITDRFTRRALIATVMLIFTVQTTLFLHNYFFVYPSTTIAEFQSYNFPEAFKKALAEKPKRIIVSSSANQPYMHAKFYREAISHSEETLPFSLEPPIPQLDTCLIYFTWNDNIVNQSPLPFRELTPANNFTKVRCY